MLRDLVEEVEKCDLAPKPASPWWTSTNEPEKRSDLSIDTRSVIDFSLLKNSRSWMHHESTRKAHEGIEERM